MTALLFSNSLCKLRACIKILFSPPNAIFWKLVAPPSRGAVGRCFLNTSGNWAQCNWRKSSAKRGLVPTLEGKSPGLRLAAPDQKKQ